MNNIPKIFIVLLFLFTSCEEPQDEFVLLPKVKTIRTIYQKGVATWYGPGFSDRKTSSGNEFDMFQFTAAHRELPLGTIIRVKNLENERCVVVLVNDRGPMNEKLILDLSKIAASNIDIIRKGSGKVDIEVLSDSENPLEKIFFVYKNLGNCHSN